MRPILEDALSKLNWPMEAAELIDFWFEADYHVDHEVLSAVHKWHRHGVRVVLMTNQESTRAEFLWNRLSKLAPVEGMVFSGELGVTKDRPDFFAQAARTLRMPDEARVVFVDDDDANVRAALAHGWHGILYQRDSKDLCRVAAALAGCSRCRNGLDLRLAS
jgi:HAD superfamily hydrolase (TIGR01509 family)